MNKRNIFIILVLLLAISFGNLLSDLALAQESEDIFKVEIINVNEKYINIFEERLSGLKNWINPKYLPGHAIFDGETMQLTTYLYGDFSDIAYNITLNSDIAYNTTLNAGEHLLLSTFDSFGEYVLFTTGQLNVISTILNSYGINFNFNNVIILVKDDLNILAIPTNSKMPGQNNNIVFHEMLYLILDGEEYTITDEYLDLKLSSNDYIIYPEEDYDELLREFFK